MDHYEFCFLNISLSYETSDLFNSLGLWVSKLGWLNTEAYKFQITHSFNSWNVTVNSRWLKLYDLILAFEFRGDGRKKEVKGVHVNLLMLNT